MQLLYDFNSYRFDSKLNKRILRFFFFILNCNVNFRAYRVILTNKINGDTIIYLYLPIRSRQQNCTRIVYKNGYVINKYRNWRDRRPKTFNRNNSNRVRFRRTRYRIFQKSIRTTAVKSGLSR